MNIPESFLSAVPLVNNWIDQYIHKHSRSRIRVYDRGFSRLSDYYSDETLKDAYYAVVPIIETPPLKNFGLGELSFFEEGAYGGITLKDTYFVTDSEKDVESLHFHELVHIVQWRVLGPERFILLYGLGLREHRYRNAPLEQIAYRLQNEFDAGQEIPDLEELIADHCLNLITNIC